jgi:hypothetical protein
MTTPKIATLDVGGARHYKVPGLDQLLPSVTSVLGVLDKPALPRWAAREAATYAIDYADKLSGLDRDEAIKRAAGAPWSARDKAASSGTDTHSVMEKIAKGEPIDFVQPGTEKAVRGVVEFWLEFKPKALHVESTVVSETYGYAGSFDLICELLGTTAMLDLKTSKQVYADTALQLVAYAFADYIIEPDGSQTLIPPIESYYVLHAPLLTTWSLVPYKVVPDDFNTFLAALEAFRWKRDRAKEILGRRTRTLS